MGAGHKVSINPNEQLKLTRGRAPVLGAQVWACHWLRDPYGATERSEMFKRCTEVRCILGFWRPRKLVENASPSTLNRVLKSGGIFPIDV